MRLSVTRAGHDVEHSELVRASGDGDQAVEAELQEALREGMDEELFTEVRMISHIQSPPAEN